MIPRRAPEGNQYVSLPLEYLLQYVDTHIQKTPIAISIETMHHVSREEGEHKLHQSQSDVNEVSPRTTLG